MEKTMKTNMKGFTLVEIMIVVAIIGLLIAIALPNFLEARRKSQTRACIANMRNCDSAIQQGMIEEPSIATAWTVSTAISVRYLKSPGKIFCPVLSAASPYPCTPNSSDANAAAVTCPGTPSTTDHVL
jgi:prepilin-type N-terminal cleavage/methylation domain-containing protein